MEPNELQPYKSSPGCLRACGCYAWTFGVFSAASVAALFCASNAGWRYSSKVCCSRGVEAMGARRPMPGINALQFGVDVSTGERSTANLFEHSYRRAEVNDRRFLFNSPDGSLWMVPDQFWVSSWRNECVRLNSSSARVVTDVAEYQRALTDDRFRVRLPNVFDLPVGGGESLGSALLRYDRRYALSSSKMVLDYLTAAREGRTTLVTWSQFASRYTATGDDVAFKKTARLQSKILELESACKDLNGSWRFGRSTRTPPSTCEKLAAEFVNDYGTHYAPTAEMGGSVRLGYTIDFMRFTPKDMDTMVECKDDLIQLILSDRFGKCISKAPHSLAILAKVKKYGSIHAYGEVESCDGDGIPSQGVQPIWDTSALEPISNLIQDNNAKAAVSLAALDRWMCNGKTYQLKRNGQSMAFDGCACQMEFHTQSCIPIPVPKLRLTNLDKVGGVSKFGMAVASTCNRFEHLVGCGCEPGVEVGNWPVRLAKFFPVRYGDEEKCVCRVIPDQGAPGKSETPSKATAICAPMKLGVISLGFEYVNNSCTPGWGGNKHSLTCAVMCPSGFKLLGGGCSSFQRCDSQNDWQIGHSHPIDEHTWYCALFEDHGVPLHYIGVTAYAVCGKWPGLETKLVSKVQRPKPRFARFTSACPNGYVGTAGGASTDWRKEKQGWRLTRAAPVNNGRPWERGSWDSKSWGFAVGEDYGTGVYHKVATGWVLCVKEEISSA